MQRTMWRMCVVLSMLVLASMPVLHAHAKPTRDLAITSVTPTSTGVTGCFSGERQTRYVVTIGDSSGFFGEIGTQYITTDRKGDACATFGGLLANTSYSFRVRSEDVTISATQPFTTLP